MFGVGVVVYLLNGSKIGMFFRLEVAIVVILANAIACISTLIKLVDNSKQIEHKHTDSLDCIEKTKTTTVAMRRYDYYDEVASSIATLDMLMTADISLL